jgi:hypothetical protein
MSIDSSWCSILTSRMRYMLRYCGCYIPGQLGINHNIIKKWNMTDKVLTYSHWYPDWYPGSTGIPVQQWNIPTVNRAEKTRATSSSHKRMKRNLFRPSALDTFIHYMSSNACILHPPLASIFHPFCIPLGFMSFFIHHAFLLRRETICKRAE